MLGKRNKNRSSETEKEGRFATVPDSDFEREGEKATGIGSILFAVMLFAAVCTAALAVGYALLGSIQVWSFVIALVVAALAASALRIASQPGTKAYGILSVLIQAWYDVEYLFTVEPSVFNPPPKVQSAVIRMTRNKVQHLDCDENLFKRVVKTVFNQRRKMLRVSLRQLIQGSDDAPFATKRPEQLTVTDFVELTSWVGSQLLCADTKS